MCSRMSVRVSKLPGRDLPDSTAACSRDAMISMLSDLCIREQCHDTLRQQPVDEAVNGCAAHPVFLEALFEFWRQKRWTIRVRHEWQSGSFVQGADPAAFEQRRNPAEARTIPEVRMVRANLTTVLGLLLCASSGCVCSHTAVELPV